MAALVIEAGDLVVRLTPLEKLGALHGDIRVPLASVRSAAVSQHPWRELRGFRAPGTGFPGVIMLGTSRGGFGRDFAALYGRRPAVLVELDGQTFHRLIICTKDPQRDAAVLSEQTPTASQKVQ